LTSTPFTRIVVSALALTALAFVESAPAAVAEPTLQARLRGALMTSQISPSRTGAFVLDLSTGGLVYAQNASTPLRPASNEKLGVALAALAELRPSFTIETTVLGEGMLSGPVWDGDLFLKGYGDPTLSRGDLTRLVLKLKAAGIAQVSGRVIADESFFDRRRVGPGWKPSFYKEESPPLSALVVDRGKVRRRVVDDPALMAAKAFRARLVELGVRVSARAVTGVAAPGVVPLARVVSAPMALIVRRMNRDSDNFVAEVLVKQLGARERGQGTTAAGAAVIFQELVDRGVTTAGVRIVDGSGLSRGDRFTARALAELLISAKSDAVIGPAFVASLPVAGVNGTLEDRMERPPARGVVRAKTGTTSRASTLSGYAGQRYVFSVLMNGSPIPWWHARSGQDRFAQVLAGAQ
jgi:D-alanyl-D-alanine carboxypeptidase/D-alanyl-D-alanine-endopeptidase (penicillin-binding protein 4)